MLRTACSRRIATATATATATARVCRGRILSLSGGVASSPLRMVNPHFASRRPFSLSSTLSYSVIDTEGHDVSQQIDSMSDSEFSRVADGYLEALSDELDVLAEDNEQLDFELSHGVLNITIPPNGSYVINKQPPNKQIWLSSPISGPMRFDLVQGRWTYLRDGTQLSSLLAGELGDAIGSEVVFEGVEN